MTRASVAAWVAAWGDEVAGVRLADGRRRFDPQLTAFGTHADVVRGLDAVHDQQWAQVWPTIEDFRFELDQLEVECSPDGQMAVALVPWNSTGIAPDGSRFERPGRATIVLRRVSDDHGGEAWVGVHTHFSLARGVPSRSHGHRPPS